MKQEVQKSKRALAVILSMMLLVSNPGLYVYADEYRPAQETEKAALDVPASDAEVSEIPAEEIDISPTEIPVNEETIELTPAEIPAAEETVELTPTEIPAAEETLEPASAEVPEVESFIFPENVGESEAIVENPEGEAGEENTDEETASYSVWVGGIPVTDDNKDDILGDGSASYVFDETAGSGTLTFSKSPVLTGVYNDALIAASNYPLLIVAPAEGLELQSDSALYGIHSKADLTIEGDVKISAAGGGIEVKDDTPMSSCVLTIHGDAEIHGGNEGAALLSGLNGVTVSGSVTGENMAGDGIYAANGSVSIGSTLGKTALDINVNGAYMVFGLQGVNIIGDVRGSNPGGNGIFSPYEDVLIDGDADVSSKIYSIMAAGDGQNVRITGDATARAEQSICIFASGGIVELGSASDLEMGEQGSCLIYGSKGVTVHGNVTGTSSTRSPLAGVYSPNGSIAIGGNVNVTAEGGDILSTVSNGGDIIVGGTLTGEAKAGCGINAAKGSVSVGGIANLVVSGEYLINALNGITVNGDVSGAENTKGRGLFTSNGEIRISGNVIDLKAKTGHLLFSQYSNITVDGYVTGEISVGTGISAWGTVSIGSTPGEPAVGISANGEYVVFGYEGIHIIGDVKGTNPASQGLVAPAGDILIEGNADLTCGSYLVYTAFSEKNIRITGDMTGRAEKNNCVLSAGGTVELGSVSGLEMGEGGYFLVNGMYGTVIHGDMTGSNEGNGGVYSPRGTIAIEGNVNVTAAGGPILATEEEGCDISVAGNVKSGTKSGSGINAKMGSVSVGSIEKLAVNGEYLINAQNGITINGDVSGSENTGGSGICTKYGAVTVHGDVVDLKAKNGYLLYSEKENIAVDGYVTGENPGGTGISAWGSVSVGSAPGETAVDISANGESLVFGYLGINIIGDVLGSNQGGYGLCAPSGDIEVEGNVDISSKTMLIYSAFDGMDIRITGDVRGATIDGEGVFAPGGNVEVGSISELTVRGEANYLVEGGQDVIIHGDVNGSSESYGIASIRGGIIVESGVWDVTAGDGFPAVMSATGITIPETHGIITPENGTTGEWGEQFKRIAILEPDGTAAARVVIAPITSEPEFNGCAVLLSGQIGLRFMLELPYGKTPADYPDSYVTFEGNKIDSAERFPLPAETTVINGRDSGKYAFTVNMSSIQMADRFTPTFHYTEDGEEKTVVGGAFSVQDYIDYALENFTGRELGIVRALADYGYYAQAYLSALNNWTIGTDYAEMKTHLTDSFNWDEAKAASDAYAAVYAKSDAVKQVSYRLKFGSEIVLRATITMADGAAPDAVLADGAEIAVKKSGSGYLAEFAGIKATGLTRSHTIEAEGMKLTVSPMSYVNAILSSATTSDAAKNLMCAVLKFAEACGA